MQRDYTKDWEDRLVTMATNEQRDEKNANLLSRAGSAVEDALAGFTISVGLMKADGALFDFNGDVRAYQTCVVDAKNMKAKEIRQIFEDCRSTDGTRGEDMKAVSDDLNTVALGLADLAEIIDPTTNKLSTTAMSGVKDGVKKKMETIRHDSKARLDRNFSTLEELQKKETAKELLGDAVDCVLDVCSIVTDAASGNWVGAVMDCYDLVNHTTGLCYDAGALSNIYKSSELGESGANNSTERLRLLENAERMRQTDDLSDAFHNIGEDMAGTGAGTFFTGLGTALDVADTAKAGYDVYSLGKSTLGKVKNDGIGSAVNPFTEFYDDADTAEKIKKANMGMRRAKGEHLKELLETKETLERVRKVRGVTNTKALIKDGKLILKVVEGGAKGELAETLIEESVGGKYVTKIKKVFDNGDEAVDSGAEMVFDYVWPRLWGDHEPEPWTTDWSDFEFEGPEA